MIMSIIWMQALQHPDDLDLVFFYFSMYLWPWKVSKRCHVPARSLYISSWRMYTVENLTYQLLILEIYSNYMHDAYIPISELKVIRLPYNELSTNFWADQAAMWYRSETFCCQKYLLLNFLFDFLLLNWLDMLRIVAFYSIPLLFVFFGYLWPGGLNALILDLDHFTLLHFLTTS
jgi:hypothetical protein